MTYSDGATAGTPQAPLLTRLVDAFRVPAFRWLWSSHNLYCNSLLMGRLAMGWLTLTLTDSAFLVGLAAGLEGVGKVGFGLFAGVIVDRMNKRTVLMVAQVKSGLAWLALRTLLVIEQIAVWHILLVALVQGAADALAGSSANTMVYQVVGRARVMNASAGTLLSFNLARISGSALAGWLIVRWGMGACCLAVGAIACLAVLPALGIRGQFNSTAAREPFWTSLTDGLRFAWRSGSVRRLLMLSIMVEMFGFAHYVMVPVIARDVLRVGAAELGVLSAAAGVGALFAIVAVAALGDFKNKGGLLMWVTGSAGLLLIAFGFTPWYWLSLALATLLGAMLTAYDVLMHVLFQLLSSDAVRGRVFSIYVLTFGFHPLGGVLAGSLAALAGAPVAVALGGGLIAAYALWAVRSLREIRPMADEPAETALA